MLQSELRVITLPTWVGPARLLREQRVDPILQREVRVFSLHLGHCRVSDYIAAKYAEGHDSAAGALRDRSDPLDDRLLRAARHGGLALRAADAYARLFRPGALLRRKLVLLLAIHESSPPSHREVTRPMSGSRASILLHVAAEVAASCVALLVGVLWFGTVALVSSLHQRETPPGESPA